MAISPDGDIYCATNSYGVGGTDDLYRSTAQKVAQVGSMPLTLADAVQSWSLPGNGNGVAVIRPGMSFSQ